MWKKLIFLLVISSLFITGCSSGNGGNEVEQPPPEKKLTSVEVADQAVEALKNKDMKKLATYIHPNKGVLFSPYGYIDLATAQVISSSRVAELLENDQVYTWGQYDGSGENIDLTFRDYFDRFVYDQDYLHAEEKAENKRLGQGNTIDNITKVFPDSTVVEYHFPGFDPQYGGMDWRSLRVVLEEVEGRWYVVALVHDEWTV